MKYGVWDTLADEKIPGEYLTEEQAQAEANRNGGNEKRFFVFPVRENSIAVPVEQRNTGDVGPGLFD